MCKRYFFILFVLKICTFRFANYIRMKKSGNRPRECPGTPQQARASPICPAGRILFSNENGKLCAAALEMNFVPHHHLAPSMWHPPPESGDAHGGEP